MVKTVGDALMPTNHRILISSLIDALDRLIARHPDSRRYLHAKFLLVESREAARVNREDARILAHLALEVLNA